MIKQCKRNPLSQNIEDIYRINCSWHARIQRRGPGGQTPTQENQKAIGFLNNTGPHPLENHKAY